jgi:hypothetical protein
MVYAIRPEIEIRPDCLLSDSIFHSVRKHYVFSGLEMDYGLQGLHSGN